MTSSAMGVVTSTSTVFSGRERVGVPQPVRRMAKTSAGSPSQPREGAGGQDAGLERCCSGAAFIGNLLQTPRGGGSKRGREAAGQGRAAPWAEGWGRGHDRYRGVLMDTAEAEAGGLK